MTSDLCGEVRTAVGVCVEYMGKNNLGEVGNPVERISTLLDPRQKTLSKQECVTGSPDKAARDQRTEGCGGFVSGLGAATNDCPCDIGLCPCPPPCVSTSPSPCPSPCSNPWWRRAHGATGKEAAGALRYGAATRQQTGCRWECGCRWR